MMRRAPSTRILRPLAALVAVMMVSAAMSACGSGSDSSPGISAAESAVSADYDYLIPAGTGDRLDAGERVDLIPADLVVTVGETIQIVNEDSRGHVIGAFYVGPGETLRQTFTEPGVLAGECSIHPSGRFSLTVNA